MVALASDQSRCTPMRHCLACGSGQLITYLDLGRQPLANDYHDGAAVLAEFPLAVNVCEQCYHSQLTHAVDPEILFRDYAYVSGTTTTLSTYFDAFVESVEWKFPGQPLNVLDIAGNDGTLLAKFALGGHNVLNIDPAENLRETSEANGVRTLTAFWSDALAQEMDIKHDVIVAMNVLGHVSNPLDFLNGCRNALADGGRIYIQTSQCEMIELGEFDTLYHEHHSYFTARSFVNLTRRAGLTPMSVSKEAIHGTSYLWELAIGEEIGDSVKELFDYEKAHGYYTVETYDSFGKKADKTAGFLHDVVDLYRHAGYAVIGYGAAAKGNTVLNFADVDLECIVDNNALKVGQFTPGRGIEIVSEGYLAEIDEPVCVVILAWNFWEEIRERIIKVRNRRNDVFVRYFPDQDVQSAW